MLDASDATSAQAAFSSDAAGAVDVVYYLVHAIGQTGLPRRRQRRRRQRRGRGRDAGVRRIVYLGGFVPEDEALSEHLASRAEVAEALTVEGGPELVWLGAAMIFGAGSTSFEMMRYVGDRFPAHTGAVLDGQPDRSDLHQRRVALPGGRGRP